MMKRKGMTLIEVIVAMAIIGIVAISVLTVLTIGFRFIALAGDKSKAGFKAYQEIEKTLTMKDVDENPTNIKLTFTSDGSTINAKGNIESFIQPTKNGRVKITIFQPKY